MRKVAILGANGQVAAEVALYLLKENNIDFTCFVRSSYSSILFELFEIDYDLIDYNDTEDVKNKLKGFDVVLDFTYPSGQSAAFVLDRIKQNINVILDSLRPGSSYVYMSSIMAHGMPSGDNYISYHKLPKTPYSYIKRKTEIYGQKESMKRKISGYSLRLGQVHGILQSVKSEFELQVINNEFTVIGKEDDLVNVIFIKNLCDALIKIIRDELKAGVYTLVCNPQWSLKSLYEFYSKRKGVDNTIHYAPFAKTNPMGFSQIIWGFAKKYREVLETYILFNFKKFAPLVKGAYRQAIVNQKLNSLSKRNESQILGRNLLGKVPTQVVQDISSDFDAIYNDMLEMERFLDAKLEICRK